MTALRRRFSKWLNWVAFYWVMPREDRAAFITKYRPLVDGVLVVTTRKP